jgi:excisionase family DNA binding protein
MSDNELPHLPDYVSIKEAAKILGISEKTVYFYVNNKRLPAQWVADVLVIPLEEVKKFRLKPAGRPRKSTPSWLMSMGDNTLSKLSIQVQLRPGQRDAFMKRLAEIRKSQQHIFPGTIERYIAESKISPQLIEIQLTWRTATMPDDQAREQALEGFRQSLADVLDWSTARYNSSTVLLHT